MPNIQAGHALVVDDEPANRDFLERLMQMAGFKVCGAGSRAEALAVVSTLPYLSLGLIDQELPDATGIEVIVALRAAHPDALLVMATMHDHRELIDQAFDSGIDVFLVKPHGFMELYRRLQEIDANTSLLRRVIIDQFGPRPYRGGRPKTQPQPQPIPVAPSPVEASQTAMPASSTPAPPAASPAAEVPSAAPSSAQPETAASTLPVKHPPLVPSSGTSGTPPATS
jgi:CheY-like chemotaxis protein